MDQKASIPLKEHVLGPQNFRRSAFCKFNFTRSQLELKLNVRRVTSEWVKSSWRS